MRFYCLFLSFQNGISYFMQRVDPHMTLVCLYEQPRPASESAVIAFLQEISDQLRLIPLMASLRPKK